MKKIILMALFLTACSPSPEAYNIVKYIEYSGELKAQHIGGKHFLIKYNNDIYSAVITKDSFVWELQKAFSSTSCKNNKGMNIQGLYDFIKENSTTAENEEPPK